MLAKTLQYISTWAVLAQPILRRDSARRPCKPRHHSCRTCCNQMAMPELRCGESLQGVVLAMGDTQERARSLALRLKLAHRSDRPLARPTILDFEFAGSRARA